MPNLVNLKEYFSTHHILVWKIGYLDLAKNLLKTVQFQIVWPPTIEIYWILSQTLMQFSFISEIWKMEPLVYQKIEKTNNDYLEKNRHTCRWKSPLCKDCDRIVGHGVGSAKRNKETLGHNVASARNITLNGSCLNLIITYPQQREIKKHRNIET